MKRGSMVIKPQRNRKKLSLETAWKGERTEADLTKANKNLKDLETWPSLSFAMGETYPNWASMSIRVGNWLAICFVSQRVKEHKAIIEV
jgi:hypothetical protein